MSARETLRSPARVVNGMATIAFDATAPGYDAFTAHHDYEAWTATIEALARPYGLRERGRVLDVGCGTGKSFLPWLARGWDVVGCDLSPSMLARAASKAPGVPLLRRDARALGDLGGFDLVLALDDVMNFIPAADHAAVFAGVARNLAPGGLLVFDLNTLHALRTAFSDTTMTAGETCVVTWRGLTSPDLEPGGVAEAALDTFVRDEAADTWRRSTEILREHHHPLDTVSRALAGAGLEVLAAHGQDAAGNTDPDPDESAHSKILVIARARPRRTVQRCASPSPEQQDGSGSRSSRR